MMLAEVTMLHYLHKFRCLEQVSPEFVAFRAEFQRKTLQMGSNVAFLAGFLYKCYLNNQQARILWSDAGLLL
ncbi:hypothetical protein NST04_26265 [Paenibacillus sp. FSL H7-0756]|uniref:hypothetical protein n=1 Tax=Paenibacillus sp. FSL H7-0756 TaxID=2954738 RepID=UPI0030F86952